jgi:alkylation response protein AidB-like acyl-CoA dehydrogenase
MTVHDFAEVHDELRSVARDVLVPTSPLTSSNGGEAGAADWALLARSGWPGLEVPELQGGAGATFAEAAVIVEELGRAATSSPFLGTAVLGVGALRLVDAGPGRDDLLAGIAAGTSVVAVALPTGADDGVAGSPPFRIERSAGRLRLHGQATFVPDADRAGTLLCVARDPTVGPVLVRVDPGRSGVVVGPQPVLDPTRGFAVVTAGGAEVDGGDVWRFTGDPHLLQVRGAIAVALDSLGLGEAMLAATVAYTSVRSQFGRPVGSFQAVKHACADMRVELAVSRELVAMAVQQLVSGDPEAEVTASMAKAHATETAVAVAGSAMQLHGGIGYTAESGVHVYLKRATLDRSLFGSPRAHRARLAQRYAGAAAR